MGTAPTSTMTNGDLLFEVADKLGYLYYGEDGTQVASVPPEGTEERRAAQRLVNKAVRMFEATAPPSGWNWQKPTMAIAMWGTQRADPTAAVPNTISSIGYDSTSDTTLLRSVSAVFQETMELKDLKIQTYVETTATVVQTIQMLEYVNSTTMIVKGNVTLAAALWEITADGEYTMPIDFGGEYSGAITYVAKSNQGISISWSDSNRIRQYRENVNDESGDPWIAAIRIMLNQPRRWELMLYPLPDEVQLVEFVAVLHFNVLEGLADLLPTPIGHNETLRAACRAMAERDVEDAPGPDWDYYTSICLPNSYRIDGNSEPRNLGYCGNDSVRGNMSIEYFRSYVYDRPNVTFNQ